MKTRTLKQLVLYNYRYVFGYSIIVLFAIYFLGWRLGSMTPGLAPQELSAAADHASVQSFISSPLAPFHGVLQFCTTKILGFSTVAIRLPSIIIGAATILLLYLLLKKWFGKSTALMSGALIVSADWFLHIARLGTGSIEFSFWVALGLLSLTKIIERKSIWLLSFTVALAALMLVPFGPYASLTLLISLFSCKVFRARVHEVGTLTKAASFIVVLLGLAGSIALSVYNLEFAKQLFAVKNLPSITEYFINIFVNTGSTVAMIPNASPVVSTTSIATIRFFELIFILFGIAMLYKNRVNRLNLSMIVLSIVLVAVSGLSRDDAAAGLMIVPAAIFMTAGVRHLIHRWKRTFPNNPYARVIAYVPLVALFVCVVAVHYVSYFRLWASQSTTQQIFSVDTELAISSLDSQSLEGKSCFIETDDKSQQTVIASAKTACRPLFNNSTLVYQESAVLMILKPASPLITEAQVRPNYPLVSATKDQNVRWLVVNRNNN